MPFDLIGTKTLGPTSLRHVYEVGAPNEEVERLESPIFNIYNYVEVRFRYYEDYPNYYLSIQRKKHILAKDLKITLKVIGQKPAFSKELGCIEHWSDYDDKNSVLKVDLVPGFLEVDFHITVDKIDSMVTKIYEDQDFTDFHLTTADGSVAVHKAVLAANSDVFKTMLSQEWKETAEGRVQIEGVSLQTLQHLKQYMYLGTLPDDGLRPLLQFAMCYLIPHLKIQCLMKLAKSVTAENLHDILEYSFMNKLPELTFAVLSTVPKSIMNEAQQITLKYEPGENNDEKHEGEKKA